MRSFAFRTLRNPVAGAIILVIVASVLGIGLSQIVASNVSFEIQKGVITLVATALIGGGVKLLLDGHTRDKEKRASDVTFVTNVLDDLKEAADCVARARMLISAHRSVKVYGEQMQLVIQHGEQLAAVVRALETRPDTLRKERCASIVAYVDEMRKYLVPVTDEFRRNYRDFADLERIYEGEIEAAQKRPDDADGVSKAMAKEKQLWDELACLPCLKEFISVSGGSRYETCFCRQLHAATYHLRAEVARIAHGDSPASGTNAESRPQPQPGAAEEAAPQPCTSLPAA